MPRAYVAAAGAVVAAVLVLFVVVSVLEVPVLTDPTALLQHGGLLAGVVGVGLLAVDVLLPVPSSIVMVANGALFGIPAGTALSLLGGVGAVAVGHFLGRRSSPLVLRAVSAAERERAQRLLARWGVAAVILSRPVPVLAETVAVMAGVTGLPARTTLAAGAVGLSPVALAYAVTGATASTTVPSVIVFLVLVGLAATPLLINSRRTRRMRQDVTR